MREEITVAVTRNTLSYETGCMTAEDQHYIARAALAGVRFEQYEVEYGTPGGPRIFWRSSEQNGGWSTLGRAAGRALAKLGLIPQDEWLDYEFRTEPKSPGAHGA